MKINWALPAIVLAFILSIAPAPVSAQLGGYIAPTPPPSNPASPKGAPLPLIGASFPGLAIGYGVYWIAKRRRSKT